RPAARARRDGAHDRGAAGVRAARDVLAAAGPRADAAPGPRGRDAAALRDLRGPGRGAGAGPAVRPEGGRLPGEAAAAGPGPAARGAAGAAAEPDRPDVGPPAGDPRPAPRPGAGAAGGGPADRRGGARGTRGNSSELM